MPEQQLTMLHNRSKCFSPARRFQQFQLELSHQKLQAVAQDYIIRWQSICRAYTWSSLFGNNRCLYRTMQTSMIWYRARRQRTQFVEMHFNTNFDFDEFQDGSAKEQTYGTVYNFGYCRLHRSSTMQPIWWTVHLRRRTVYSLKAIVTYSGVRQCNE